MKRKLHYILVAIFLLTTSVFNSVYSQEEQEINEDLMEMSLEELMNIQIYSVTKQQEKLSEAPMAVYRISKDELNRWGVRYLYETLGRTPGYSFYNTDYYGQSGVMARGSQSIWRYGYSIELMPIIDFGHTTLPHEFFGSMEAVRGPAGLAWGSGANAGLINNNIRTDLDGAELVTSYGNNNQYSVSALYGHKFNDDEGSVFVGFNQKGQDYESQKNTFGVPGQEWKTNGVNGSYSFIGKVEHKRFKGIFYHEHNDHVSPQWWADTYDQDSNGNWGLNDQGRIWQGIRDSTGEPQHDQLDMTAYRIEYALPIDNDNFSISLYHNYYKRLWFYEPLGSGGDQRRDIGFNLNINLLDDRISIALGSDLYGQTKEKTNYLNHPWALAQGVDFSSGIFAPNEVVYHNAFTQVGINATDNLKFIGGARIDYQDDGEFADMIVFYRAGALYRLGDNMVVKYFYNNAPRRPQSNERSSTSPEAEKLVAHELSFVGNINSKYDFNVTAYYQKLDNQITKSQDNTFNDYINTGGLEGVGIEWGVKAMPVSNLLLYWNGSYNSTQVLTGYARDANGNYTLDGSGNRLEQSESHNKDYQPLFVPQFDSFLGAEYNVNSLVKVNVAWRGIYGIPYIDLDDNEQKAGTNFVDLTLISKKFWDKLELSFVALNVLDNRDGVPAYGEHVVSKTGTLEPEGRSYYIKSRFTIGNKR